MITTIRIDDKSLIVVTNTDKIYPRSLLTNIDRLADSLAHYADRLKSRTHLKTSSIEEIGAYGQDAKIALSFAALLMVEVDNLYKKEREESKEGQEMKTTFIIVKFGKLEEALQAIAKAMQTPYNTISTTERYNKECHVIIDQLHGDLSLSASVPSGTMEMNIPRAFSDDANPKETPSPIPEGTDNDGAPLWPVKASVSLDGLWKWEFEFHDYPLIKNSLSILQHAIKDIRSRNYIENTRVNALLYNSLNIAFWYFRSRDVSNKAIWGGEQGPEYDDQ